MNKFLFYDFFLPEIIEDNDVTGVRGGGATVQTYNWIKGLLACNQKIGVLVEDRDYPKKVYNTVDYLRTYVDKRGIPVLNWLYRYSTLNIAVKKFKPDYIYQTRAGIITYVLCVISKINKIVFIHRISNDVHTDKRIKVKLGFLSRYFYTKGLKNTDVILCQNQYQYCNITKRYPGKVVLLLHNPIDQKTISSNPLTYSERKYIAWIGIFRIQKNLNLLCNIAEKCLDVEFCIAGKSIINPDNETKTALKKLKSLKNVKFTGFLRHSEVVPFLKKAYALLNTSHYEGFSNTFLEAFAAGTPVVTTSTIDPDNIIRNNRLGIISETSEELCGAVKKIIQIEGYNDMSRRCQKYVQKMHNPEELARKLLGHLNSIQNNMDRINEENRYSDFHT